VLGDHPNTQRRNTPARRPNIQIGPVSKKVNTKSRRGSVSLELSLLEGRVELELADGIVDVGWDEFAFCWFNWLFWTNGWFASIRVDCWNTWEELGDGGWLNDRLGLGRDVDRLPFPNFDDVADVHDSSPSSSG
jgi:hypothetical protein